MVKGGRKTITVRKSVWDELTRIKYARGFKTHNDVIEDLLDDEVLLDGVE